MSSASLTLQSEKGWFAAGAEVEKAMSILSDGAFKLFMHLCLEALRDQGVVRTSPLELARRLNKGNHTIGHYLREMEQAGVCRLSGFAPIPYGRGLIEMTDEYWPYHRSGFEAEPEETSDFVAHIRRLLQERACIRASFSTADEILARQWLARNITLERIEQVILLGCTRKYVAWRNHHGQVPIASLRYFEPILEELEGTEVSPAYWQYVRSRMERVEKLWIESHRRDVSDELGRTSIKSPGPKTKGDDVDLTEPLD